MVEDIKNIADISGMGGDYESQCQKMLQAGWEWLCKKNKPKLHANVYDEVFGIIIPTSKDAKDLSKFVLDSVKNDCTGAMHHAVMNHLFYISRNSLNKWKGEVSKK